MELKFTVDDLWCIATSSSPLTSALALTVLDKLLGGKISELTKKLQEVKRYEGVKVLNI